MILADGSVSDQFGQELTVDLYDCDLGKISDGAHIKNYVIKLCDEVIDMKRYGEPMVEHFGHENPITSGYSLVQLIETSCVSGHFSEFKRSAYINVFSCKWFDEKKAAEFTKRWFGALKAKTALQSRF
ncbi:MAG: S-adenosylmethionine decarboxylase [Patescibacteria group bacterium]